MKIAIIGGAGVRVPLLAGGLSRSDLRISEIALYDLDRARLVIIADLAQRMAGGVRVTCAATADAAIEGADFVITSIRVGGAAQTKLIKSLSGGIRTDLAQYRELAAFAQFASDLDEATRKQLDRGARVTELLKQAQYSPLSVSLMGSTLFAVNKGFLDDIAVNKVLAFEHGLHAHLKTYRPPLDTANSS